MLVQSKGTPEECPACKDPNLDYQILENGGNVLKCGNCEVWIILEAEASELEEETSPCQHCGTVGDLQSYQGEVWCGYCGLDPDLEYTGDELASLWHPGSDIRKLLSEDVEALNPQRSMGKFLRTECGPHCSLALNCPQSKENFLLCFKEWRAEGAGDDMAKKKKKHKKKNKHHNLATKQTNRSKTTKETFLQCSAGGWFATRFRAAREVSGETIETNHLEQVGAT